MEPGNTSRGCDPELFDRYAPQYQRVLNRALAPSGETAEYFARARVEWLQRCLCRLHFAPATVLDYGCGIGGSIPFLKEILRPRRILGVDVSPESIRQARQMHSDPEVEFATCADYASRAEFQLVFCNGVFHHILPGQRPAVLRYVHDSLAPGGVLALWENNPWNPATRYLMSRCEFDHEAVPITPVDARKLLCGNGFQVLGSSTHFYFPRWLRWLRSLEPRLARLPLGAQYLVLAHKPA